MPATRCIFKNVLRTFNGFKVKIKFKKVISVVLLLVLNSIVNVHCNRPPRFLIDGQTEIVLRLKEGSETPMGTLIYKLKGFDADGDKLQFGVKPSPDSDVIRIENTSETEANIYLNQELDREEQDEYNLVLTLTDGHLGYGTQVTQSLLLLVEDVNDNAPVFLAHQISVIMPENAENGQIVATLQAKDADEGPYGQVLYRMEKFGESPFIVSTVGEKAIVRLAGSLDYEKQSLHQLKILAQDRAKDGRVNTGTAVLLIKVEDIEDQPPEFIKINPVARIPENSPVGTSVLKVTAVDGDRGISNRIKYLMGSNEISDISNLFGIDENSGIIRTRGILDRESKEGSSYTMQIIAVEVGSKINPPEKSTTEVTVIVTDINDETPTFKSSIYECEIAENSPVNTPLAFKEIAVPEVFDFDQGINGTFQLYIKGASDIFDVTPSKAINEAAFILKVKNSSALDFERIRMINFTIVAKEIVKSNPKFSEVPVVVSILDRNDNYPEFTKSLYEVWIPENCNVGSTVAWVQALDDDSGKLGTMGVRYTNLAGSIEHMLNLHPTSGVITVKTAGGPNWDREQVSKHFLTVEARDDLGNGNRNSVQLVINIEDVNDNPPIFSQTRYEAKLLENKINFEKALEVVARDVDLNGTKNSEIEYSLFGELHNNFSIDHKTGIIVPKQPLDFEKIEGSSTENIRSLYLTIRAQDHGTPSLFSEVTLIIYVEDVNDHPPIFEYMFYNGTVAEDVKGGTPIIKVHARDLDGSSPNNLIVYRIQNGADDKFVIDPESGLISVARGASLDPDLTQPKRTRYSLTVVAFDGATGEKKLQDTVNVNITILDVNNKSPKFLAPGKITVKENTPVGSTVTRVRAIDLDKMAKLVFKIDINNCQAVNEKGVVLKSSEFDCIESFYLDNVTGVLSVTKNLDREIVETFKIGLIVEDINSENGLQQDTVIIIIEIEDTNDNSPRFRHGFYKFSVTENSKNGILIGTVFATDADKNNSVSYYLDGKNDFVYLEPNSGDLIVSNKIDHEAFQSLNFSIKATDSGTPPRSSHAEVFIQILDENDNNPFFLTDPRSLSISENTPVGLQIATIQALDADSGEFGKITYLLDRLSSQGKFSLDSESGALRVAEKLDREEKTNYLLIIEAWDNYQYGFNNGESRNAFKHLNVTILDVNDNVPVLHIIPQCVNITEFQETGRAITTIHATDLDDPSTSNGQVIIDISDGNQEGLFELQQVSEWSADVKTTSSLRGRHGNYSLIMRAQDLGTPSHLVEEVLNVCVTDYNDHAPIFVSPPHNSTLRVPENATVGSALVQIKALDEDVDLNGAVRYRLKNDPAGHWKTFNLQPVSGILELRLPLNRKKQKIYDIRIEAYDLGVPTSLSSDLDLTVYISDINDYQPQFLVDEFFVNFTENKQPNLEIAKLPTTIDRDEIEFDGPKGPICYFIIGGNENRIFHLNPVDHVLTTTRMLDREETEMFILLVKATEDCSKPPKNESFFDSSDDTQLKVVVKVLDVNDNPPLFIHRVFTGGVSTATSFGTKFMNVRAVDLDSGSNAKISYYLTGKIQMTLTEGLENLQRLPFLVEKETGEIMLNFDPQQGMKGYFDFMVLANDTGGLQDTARVFIYLLREDQRVRFVLRQQAPDLRDRIETFREILGNVTGAIVNIDEFKVHSNHDGSVDKTRTDLYLHLVDRKDNSILEVEEVLKLVDRNTERLDALFKEFNVLDTQPGGSLALQSKLQSAGMTFWLSCSTLFLLLLLMLCLALCINQRQTYHRKLKAATATAYVSADSDIDGRGLSIINVRVPNTNKHSMEGSNPIWLRAYENEWYKNGDDYSNASERDSLDENIICNESTQTETNNQQNNNSRNQNLYQTLPTPPPRKLETTEL